MTRVSTHVLDTALGRPAPSVAIRFERIGEDGAITLVGIALTDDDGRVPRFGPDDDLVTGTYRLTFDTERYFSSTDRVVFFPRVEVVFRVNAPGEQLHIPLLLSPFGYSTYRGS